MIYVPYAERLICETPGSNPRGWLRQGMHSSPLDTNAREQLRREKRIVDFELSYCCPYHPDDLDKDVVAEFRKTFPLGTNLELTDEDMLYQVGALLRDGQDYAFTNAGFLFFAANPQRRLGWAYVRLLRFDHPLQTSGQRTLPSFERSFSGAIPEQIRAIRSFFRDSGFLKVYQRRKPDGGFFEEPELPPIAVDEAIVNSVAHRDYDLQLPIECEHYQNALVVINPGRIQQRDNDVPQQFTLAEHQLDHKPPNPKLLEWLKLMRDKEGAAFVKALSEGTRQMQREMETLGLPSPEYLISPGQTRLTLTTNALERESAFQEETFAGKHSSDADYASPYYANLFELFFEPETQQDPGKPKSQTLRQDFTAALKNALYAKGWFIDSANFSRLIAHRRGQSISLPQRVQDVLGLYPAYVFQLREYWGKHYLCIDYKLEVKNLLNLRRLADQFAPADFVGLIATANWNGWQKGRIISADAEFARVMLFDYEREELVSTDKVIPKLPKTMLDQVVEQVSSTFDLPKAIKEHGLSLHPNGARIRADKTMQIASFVASEIFPISIIGQRVKLLPSQCRYCQIIQDPKHSKYTHYQSQM